MFVGHERTHGVEAHRRGTDAKLLADAGHDGPVGARMRWRRGATLLVFKQWDVMVAVVRESLWIGRKFGGMTLGGTSSIYCSIAPNVPPELLLTGKSKRNKIKRLRRRPLGAAKLIAPDPQMGSK